MEKRDRPELAAKPVIVGGGTRGVVTAACYVARLYGVRSAMPMFKALKACPDAVVIRPDFAKYVAVSRQVRVLMSALTPLLQPLSIDEAVLDLAGTEALHGAPPAVVLARFARTVEHDIGITVSIGLAANRLLAKIAAGRDKPRGFAVIDAAEAASLLAPEPVRLLPGIGPVQARKLESLGITRLGQLQVLADRDATRRLGEDGPALVRRARGEDARLVDPTRETKSISAETTFDTDLVELPALERHLWRLAEKLARRLKENDLCRGRRGAQAENRAVQHPHPRRPPAEPKRAAGSAVLRHPRSAAARGHRHRLPPHRHRRATPWCRGARPIYGDLADAATPRMAAAQAAIDTLRERYGATAIGRGRGFGGRRGEAE